MSTTQPKHESPLPAEWQIADATELYRISSWGDPFFFVNENGHVAVRPLDEAGHDASTSSTSSTSCAAAACSSRCCIRFQDVLRAHVRRAERGVPRRDRGGGLRQRLPRHLPDQGEPAARGRRRGARRRPAVRYGPRVRLEGGADRVPAADRRRDAARVQRREGPHDAVADDRRRSSSARTSCR